MAVDRFRQRRHDHDLLRYPDLLRAQLLWDKYVQATEFPDTGGLIRCGGRFENAELSPDMTDPTLLPRKHLYTSLLVHHYHLKVMHSGSSQTLGALRSEYWIPKGR